MWRTATCLKWFQFCLLPTSFTHILLVYYFNEMFITIRKSERLNGTNQKHRLEYFLSLSTDGFPKSRSNARVAAATVNHSLLLCRDKRIDQDVRTKTGSTMQKVWIEILNPTENDKGKYTLEMFDGHETHKRCLDLSGQGGWRRP